jgi:hypothetical protein
MRKFISAVLFVCFLFILSIAVTGCAEPSGGTINGQPVATVTVPPPAPFDPVKATAEGKEFITELYGTKNPNGPICFPEKVSGEYTQCSFTYDEIDGTLKAGVILCSNKGCFEGQAPVTVPVEDRPVQVLNNSSGSTFDNNEWLLWYLLFSNGGTSYHYNSWHANTPAYGRTAYYSPTYVPTTQSRSYYTSTYSKPVSTVSTTKYTPKTTPTVSTSSSSYKSTSTTSKPAATSTSSSSKSSGYGTSTRSSGYSSGSSSRSSSSGRR